MLIPEKLDKPFEEIKTKGWIVFTCDYCGRESKKVKKSYIASRQIVEKDCCSCQTCMNVKKKESCLKKYGHECSLQAPEVQEKVRQTYLDKHEAGQSSQISWVREKARQAKLERLIQKNALKSEAREKIRQANLEKFGHENASQSPEAKEKRRQTNLEKFGVENPLQSPEVQEKKRQTCLEKYGHEHPMQSPKVQEKSRQTCLKNLGVDYPMQSSEVQEKSKQTNIEKYGYENPLQSPEIQDKVKKTCLEIFGYKNASSSPDIQDKRKQTNLERFGHENAFSSSEIQNKVKQTNIGKYGFENTFSSPDIQDKARQTCLERFGHEYALQSPEIQEKIKQANIEKYGFENPFLSPEVQEKIRQTNIERYGSPYPTRKFGKTQKEIQDWLNSFGFNFKSDHTVLGSKELDLYDSNLNFAIEYCGLYWHHENSPQPRPSNYHISKFNICKEKGIQLITIFEDEWLNNQEVIKSVILSKLGVFEKRLYARKCIAKEISKKEFTDFCDKHHVQGGNSLAKVCFGLYYQDELIGVMDLGVHHRKQTKGEMVLTRLCFKAGHQIVGGASKLFSYCVNWCKNNGIKKIISWSDSRWSNGSIYKNLNFKLEEELGSDYAYVNMSYPKERISKQSQMKCNTGCPKDISEKEWALKNGLSRIWDCGKVRWAFNV